MKNIKEYDKVNENLSNLKMTYSSSSEYSIIAKTPWFDNKTKEYSHKNIKITLESDTHSTQQIYHYILNCLHNDAPIDCSDIGVDVISITELKDDKERLM